MTARGFVESLANRTAGNHQPIVIRPAISPEMIPDAFSAAEDIVAPIPPSPKIESVARPPEAFVPAQSPGNKSSPAIQNDAAKPQKRNQSQDAVESKDAPPTARIDEKLFVSPSAPTDVHAEPYPQKPLAEKKGDKETLVQDDAAKPQILPADTYKTLEPARFAPDNSKEIPKQHDKEEYDDNNAISPGSVIEDKGSAQQQPGAEAAKEEDAKVAPAIVIKPEENQLAKEPGNKQIATPHNDEPNRADLQQGISRARPAMQAQSQKYDQDDNTVTINIGRIEVRAVFPQRQGLPAKEQTGVSLSQYLKLRSEGKI